MQIEGCDGEDGSISTEDQHTHSVSVKKAICVPTLSLLNLPVYKTSSYISSVDVKLHQK